MRDQNTMPGHPRLRRPIADRTLAPIARSPRRKLSHIIPQHATAPGLVEGDPVLHFRPERIEDNPRVVGKVRHKFLLVQEPAIPLLQLERQVPVEKRDQRRDPRSVQVVHELDIVLEALLVDRVVASAELDDARPFKNCVNNGYKL